MINIMFVCHGNICRSPMAEFIMKDLVRKTNITNKYYIESSATSLEEIGSDIHYGTKDILNKYKINYNVRKARRITMDDYNKFDYIIAMDNNNIKNLYRLLNIHNSEKIYKLMDFTTLKRDVLDPWYTGDFDSTYDDILQGCIGLLNFLEKNIK